MSTAISSGVDVYGYVHWRRCLRLCALAYMSTAMCAGVDVYGYLHSTAIGCLFYGYVRWRMSTAMSTAMCAGVDVYGYFLWRGCLRLCSSGVRCLLAWMSTAICLRLCALRWRRCLRLLAIRLAWMSTAISSGVDVYGYFFWRGCLRLYALA